MTAKDFAVKALLGTVGIGVLAVPAWVILLILLPVLGISLLVVAQLYKFILVLIIFAASASVVGLVSKNATARSKIAEGNRAVIGVIGLILMGIVLVFGDSFKSMLFKTTGASVSASGLRPAVAAEYDTFYFALLTYIVWTIMLIMGMVAVYPLFKGKKVQIGGKAKQSVVNKAYAFLVLPIAVIAVLVVLASGIGADTGCFNGARICDKSMKANAYSVDFNGYVCNDLRVPGLREEPPAVRASGILGFEDVKVTSKIWDSAYTTSATQNIGSIGLLKLNPTGCKDYSITLRAYGNPDGGSREYNYEIKSTSRGGYSDTKKGVFTVS